ncbi:uncharacterized protein LOC129892043 [Solanum dulcamara]|uniref:uncharacterized protein LOC129892043 n=1 Tax=Solanum dulcamara TaxID=45834 RepID=UPI0024852E13|nr:uncharacterized protein LOC129892043 [Solanum dulcamara]
MSFLTGRLAGKEGAFFFEESKHAVTRLAQKINKNPTSSPSNSVSVNQESVSPSSDVLPEILRHSLPSKIFHSPASSADSSLSHASKWVLPSDTNKTNSVSPDALNPLTAYISLPQVTFGPKRWQLPDTENSVQASTANDLRRDKYTPINPEKLKAAAVGMSQIAKAFAIATALVFGGSALTFGFAASKLELHNSDDIRTKGKDIVQSRLETFKEQLSPLRIWAEEKSKKWRLEKKEDIKEKPLVKELSKILGAKSSN